MDQSTWQKLQSWMAPPRRSSRRRGQHAVEVTPAQVNVLESRALLTAGITIDLSGSWTINGQATTVEQTNDVLTLTNERGDVAHGHVVSDTQIVADDWNNLNANVINGNTINWANGTTWVKDVQAVPDLSGTWYIDNQATSIAQSGSVLTFTNEFGMVAQGRFVSATQIVADGWNGLNATLVNGDTINWANGSTWTKTTQTYPDVSGSWFINNLQTNISTVNGQLQFTNERGGAATGRFLSSTQVIADGWGGLTGTIVNGDTINWSNGSVWSRTQQSAPAALPENWNINGHGTTINTDNFGGLIFTNEFGQQSSGYYRSANQIVASDWGNLAGTLNGARTQITWGNGTTWSLTS